MEAALESADAGIVTAVGIHLSSAGAYRSMHEGSEEKEKEYTAICWAEKPLSDEDELKLSNIRDMEISQATPVRVLHRRTSMARPRTIVSATVYAGAGVAQVLHAAAEDAGGDVH